jgi:hypothetical protein
VEAKERDKSEEGWDSLCVDVYQQVYVHVHVQVVFVYIFCVFTLEE